MKLSLYFLILIFFLMGCAANLSESADEKSASSDTASEKSITPVVNLSTSANKSKITTIKKKDYLDSETIISGIEKIYKIDSSLIYKSGMKNGTRDEIEIEPGAYNIQFRCENGEKYNYNWMAVNVEANRSYVLYCLKEIEGKTMFGVDKIVSFFPFISNAENINKDIVANQKVIDKPSQEMLHKAVEQGETRLIIYNTKASIFVFDNSFSYSVSINGRPFDKVRPHKYLSIDLKNNETNLEISYVDVFTFKKSININLTGGIKYVECSNGAASASIEVKSEKPEGFEKTYKPQYPFKL